MAIPQDNRYFTEVVSATLDATRKEHIDLLFNSNALFARAYKKNKVVLVGGDEIQVNFSYDKSPFTWFTGMGSLPIEQKETSTLMRFDWKQAAGTLTFAGIDTFKNRGPYQQFDIVNNKLVNVRMTMADKLGDAMFNDGTVSDQIIGLRQAVNTTGDYGKITRGTDVIGTAVKGNVDSTGGAITIPTVNSLMGTASAGGAVKPDLLITTQTLWDALWARVHPLQRFSANEGHHADIGFDYISISGAAVVADSHCPVGYMFGLNTDYVEFYVGEGKDFAMRGPFELHSQDAFTAQIMLYCALVVSAPRLCFNASGLTA